MTVPMEPEGPGPGSVKYDDLLMPSSAIAEQVPLRRATATYTAHDEPFLVKEKNYERQYAQLYFYRLLKLRPCVAAAARQRWPGVAEVRVMDAQEGVDCVLVGTLYKEMKLKPSILDEYVKDKAVHQHLGRTRFTSPEDRLVLEDEGARITLTGEAIGVAALVTGIVISVRGRVLPSGEFEVMDSCFAGVPPQSPRPAIKTFAGEDNSNPRYIALLSGLGMADKKGASLALQLAADYLTGALGSSAEHAVTASIVRVVVAGGLLAGASELLARGGKYADAHERQAALAGLRDADMALTQLTSAGPVDVMPGAADPSGASLPQQPLHRALLRASASGSLERSPNPHAFEVQGVRFLGSSGQNVTDVMRYAEADDPLDVLEGMVRWRHIAPTAPDTLPAYPFYDRDPFMLDTCPDVFFAGNQARFVSRMVSGDQGQRVQLVSVPAFSQQACLVLLNLETLACHPIYFDAMQE